MEGKNMSEKYIIKSEEWEETTHAHNRGRTWIYNVDEFEAIIRLQEKTGDVQFFAFTNSCLDADNCFYYDLLQPEHSNHPYLAQVEAGRLLRFVDGEDGTEIEPNEEIEVPAWFIAHVRRLYDEENRLGDLFREFVMEDEAGRDGCDKFENFDELREGYVKWLEEKEDSRPRDTAEDSLYVAHEWGLWYEYHIENLKKVCIDY